VHRDGDALVVTCAVCGPSRLDRAGALALVDPVLGLSGPLGRFQSAATAAERRRLVALVQAQLDDWPDLHGATTQLPPARQAFREFRGLRAGPPTRRGVTALDLSHPTGYPGPAGTCRRHLPPAPTHRSDTTMADNTRPDPWEGTDVIGQTVRDLPVLLTEEEVLQRGRDLALQLREVATLEADQAQQLRDMKARHKADMRAAKREQDKLQEAVNDGREDRPVTCVHLADFARGICTTVRADTSAVVATRRLRDDEVQVQLAVPLRVVPGPDGRLRRADGRGLDSLPFVRTEHCAPLRCRECEARHGAAHAEDCDLRGLGEARLVATDQCDAQACLECDAPLGERHAEDCPHANG